MKKGLQVITIAVLMLMAAGCGSNTLSGSVKDAANAAGSGVVDTADSTQTASLNVENDGFTFEELTRKVGATETDVLTLIGAADKSDAYETTLFGEKTQIVLTSDGETISTIQLTFADTNADSLKNAISEQLAQDGEGTDAGTKWTYEGSTVTLSGDQGCTVTITKQ